MHEEKAVREEAGECWGGQSHRAYLSIASDR